MSHLNCHSTRSAARMRMLNKRRRGVNTHLFMNRKQYLKLKIHKQIYVVVERERERMEQAEKRYKTKSMAAALPNKLKSALCSVKINKK